MTKPGPRLPVLPSHEQETVKAIMQLLKFHHIPAWRMNTGATKIGERFLRFGVVGMSDIIGVVPEGRKLIRMPPPGITGVGPLYQDAPGQFLAIEVKSATGKPTAAQQNFLDTVNAAGGKGLVARSVDDVRKELGLP